MEQREQFLAEVLEGRETISALCRKYGISRKTGHKWINRAAMGLQLCDQSRRPHQQPSKTAEDIEQKEYVDKINSLDFTDKEREMIFSENAKELLK